MARPKKLGLDYFTNDVSFYQDIKIRKMIRYKGIQAVSVYHIILCQVYASGYYLEWDDDLPFIISETADLQEDYVKEAISFAIEIGLFNKVMFNDFHVLTSKGIQERFFDFCSIAKRKLPTSLPYLLLLTNAEPVSSLNNGIPTEKTAVNSEETIVNSVETPENLEKSTQSKVKESKVKHSSSADIRAREDVPGGWSGDDLKVYGSVDGEIAQLRASPLWKEQVFMRFRFLDKSDQKLDEYLDRFCLEVKASGKCHQHLGDAKKHFMNWMIIQEDKLNKESKGYGNNQKRPIGERIKEDLLDAAEDIRELNEERERNLRDGVSEEIWNI